MFVAHAVWLRRPAGAGSAGAALGGLAIWAEDSGLPTAVPRRPGRPARVRAHPYAAPAESLAQLLEPHAATASTLTLQLPGGHRGPAQSPELVRDTPGQTGPAREFGAWQVPALELDPDQALALLAEPPPDLVAGASLAHVASLAGFAVDLTGRGRVLPGVRPEGPYAVWRPVLTGPDASWARTLAASMPSLLAAADPADRRELWAQVLDALVDAAVRAALGPGRLDRGRGGERVTRGWLGALTGTARRFAADPAEAAALAEAVARWQADAVAGPVRGCFRLLEPAADDEAWQVSFGLQATDEQSLVVEADVVWRSRGTLPALARQLGSPQEALLTELGKASRLYPDLDLALRDARPTGLPLDVDGAHRFLSSVAPVLATAGFGVQLPGWWSKPSSRLGVRLSARTPPQPGRVAGAATGLGFDAIAEFRYQLAVAGAELTAEELAELADVSAPLVRLRGQWIELDARRLAAGLKLVGQERTATVGELLRLGLGVDGQGAGVETDGLPVEGVHATGWLGELLSGQAEQRLAPVELHTDAFTGQLRPYQARGLAWLDFLRRTGLGGILADDMGLGKTVQLLALLAHDVPPGRPGREPSLLICPMSLVGNWQREAARFTPQLRVHVHHGAERARGPAFAQAVADADLVITTYALAARDAAELRKIGWARVVVDEAQAIKNSATKQATAIRSLPAAARIAVTGTPVENRLADLWSILEFTNPGMLGPASAFKKRYAEPIERHGDDEAAQRLRRFTAPFILRRVKTDRSIISDLPEKLEMDLLCNLTAEQASLYQAVVEDMLHRISETEGIERRGLVLATMTKLKQVCNHPAHFLRDGSGLPGRSGKLERLDEIVEEILAVRERALLFTQYAEFGAMLHGHLAGRFGREVLFLHGGVGQRERDAMVARFQEPGPGGPPLFVLSLKAGGTGLNLTAANHVVHVDRWWNPAVEDQATDRAYRIGQGRPVQVRKFVCAGTIEEKIAAMIAEKRGLAARIVGTGEQWLTELSTGQLSELFRLEAGAVVE